MELKGRKEQRSDFVNKMSARFARDVHTLLTSFKSDKKVGKASNTSRGWDVIHKMSTDFDSEGFS